MKNRHEIEKKWAQEKYKVMMHSQKHYDMIRETIKSHPSMEDLNTLLEEAYQIPPADGSVMNAYHHMWGYFKKICTEDERETARLLEERFRSGDTDRDRLLKFIAVMADQYEVEYLQNASVLSPYRR